MCHPIDQKSSIINLEYKAQILNYSIDGLNIITEKGNEIFIKLAADVLFDFDKDSLKPSAFASFKTMDKHILETWLGDIRIEGHTDWKGSKKYDQLLSKKIAISIQNLLITGGSLSNVQLVTKSFRELKQVFSKTK